MVFNNQPNHHNKVNLRDISTDPHNLFGDANLKRDPANQTSLFADGTEMDEPPPLEHYRSPY